jgi:outer membrane protein OmpA-like peptidoglycan-associated protein
MKTLTLRRVLFTIVIIFSFSLLLGCAAEPPKPVDKPAPKVIDKMTLKVLFDYNKATLTKSDIDELEKAIIFVKKYPGSHIILEGHTDNLGTDKYNLELSQKRAEAVRQHLIQAGAVAEARISATGFGSARPVAPNKTNDGKDNPDGRAQNRRVEIIIMSD